MIDEEAWLRAKVLCYRNAVVALDVEGMKIRLSITLLPRSRTLRYFNQVVCA